MHLTSGVSLPLSHSGQKGQMKPMQQSGPSFYVLERREEKISSRFDSPSIFVLKWRQKKMAEIQLSKGHYRVTNGTYGLMTLVLSAVGKSQTASLYTDREREINLTVTGSSFRAWVWRTLRHTGLSKLNQAKKLTSAVAG